MAVVVKTTPEAPPRNPVQQLAVSSWLGALYVLCSAGFVLTQLPILWSDVFHITTRLRGNEFLSEALLLIVTALVIVGLVWLGRNLEGPHPQPGLRAGIFFAGVLGLLSLVIGLSLGNWLATRDLGEAVALVLTVLITGGLLFGTGWLFLRPAFSAWLVRVEGQGWFHATWFKATQGQRVRRGTLVGLLVLAGCGVYVVVSHETLGRGDWELTLPFTSSYALYLLFNVNFTAPVLLFLLLFWLSWRVVNWPVFADFLIATEAEMNKVSWTTRKRLVQDSIVVLVTMFLMALFLFVVDIVWIKALSWKYVNVLQVDIQAERQRQQAPTEW